MNQLFEIVKPWESLKQDRIFEVSDFLDRVVQPIRAISYWIEPFMPDTSGKILRRLEVGRELKRASPLFPRIHN